MIKKTVFIVFYKISSYYNNETLEKCYRGISFLGKKMSY